MSASWRYRAVDRRGGEQRGLVVAGARQEAIQRLEARGLRVTGLDEAVADKADAKSVKKTATRIRELDKAVLLAEMATLLEAGVPLAEAAPSLEAAYAETALGPRLGALRRSVQAGLPVAAAFRASELELPEYVHTLIESGEASGRLAGSLRDAATQLDYEHTVVQEFRTALIYPSILVGAGIAAVLAIFVIVVPRFASMLKGGRAELPAISRWVIEGGLFFRENALACSLVAAAIAGGLSILLRQPAVRQALLQWISRLPVAGAWLHETETGRWATMLGTLLANRVPLLDALDLAARGLRLNRDRSYMRGVTEELRRGRSLSEVLAEGQWIAPTRLNLLRVGERAGALPKMLGELG
ncbi:MAG: type II secretion system F family protein, partial [Gammaproteobacteria bacterium]